MSTQKFLVTHENTIFKVNETTKIDQYLIEPMEIGRLHDNFAVYREVHVFPTTLPLDLLDQVLFHLFKTYLRNGDYRAAVILSSRFSKRLTGMIYRKFFRSTHPLTKEMRRRISGCLIVIHLLETEMLIQPNPAELEFFAFQFQFKEDHHYEPWNLFHDDCEVTVNFLEKPQTLDLDEDWGTFVAGETFGEVIWMDGHYEGPFFVAKKVLYPIIIFDIHTTSGKKLNSFTYTKMRDWLGFYELMRLIYGPNTGIFYVCKPPASWPFTYYSDPETTFLRSV